MTISTVVPCTLMELFTTLRGTNLKVCHSGPLVLLMPFIDFNPDYGFCLLVEGTAKAWHHHSCLHEYCEYRCQL